VVAQAGVKRFAWPAAAAVAAVLLAALAVHGERPQSGIMRAVPPGVLAGWDLLQITEVSVATSGGARTFRRGEAGQWRVAGDGSPAAPGLAERIEIGLKLLRTSPPQRILDASEVAGRPLAEFGLASPRLTVSLRTADGAGITIAFGSINPLGLARYARVDGRPGLLLLATYLAEAWERVAQPP